MAKKQHSIASGTWQEGVTWEFFVDSTEPPLNLITGVFALITTADNNIVLVKHKKRGWEFPGGHIDPHESLEYALRRECKEEAGVDLVDIRQFGYKKITHTKPFPHRDKPGEFYPFPISYLVYYQAKSSTLNTVIHDKDITEVQMLTVSDAKNVLSDKPQHAILLSQLVEDSDEHAEP